MPFVSTRSQLVLSDQDKTWLSHISQSRSEAAAKVHRAQILLRYYQGDTISAIAAALRTNRPKVERCIAKALQLGVRTALEDLPGRERRARISDEDKTWVVNLACQKPKELGYAQELWTTRMLAKHIRKHCGELGYPSLSKLGRGTVSKILAAHPVRPHKLEYYLERRDPEFEAKMIEVLHVYREVGVWRTTGLPVEVGGYSAMTRNPGFRRSATRHRICPRCRVVMPRWNGIMNTRATARCPCWRVSTC